MDRIKVIGKTTISLLKTFLCLKITRITPGFKSDDVSQKLQADIVLQCSSKILEITVSFMKNNPALKQRIQLIMVLLRFPDVNQNKGS